MEEIKKGVLQAFITNMGKYSEGVLVGEWVSFPNTSEELQRTLDSIGIGKKNANGETYSNFFITDYDYEIELPGLSKLLGEYESLDELNYFASLIAAMSDEERNQLQAAFILAGYTGGLKDFINLAQNLDCYNLYPDILTMEDLGRHYLSDRDDIPEDLINYVDYEDYGRDASINENGVFTSYGYVAYNNSKFVEYYNGKKESIPEEYRITVGATSPEQADTDETTLRFNSVEFEKLIPNNMRFKQKEIVNGNEMYWVTQGIFTVDDLRDFQQAVRDYDGNVKKFYVTPRDLSPSYTFEDDAAQKVMAIVTPDAILKDDYVKAIQEAGLGDDNDIDLGSETEPPVPSSGRSRK